MVWMENHLVRRLYPIEVILYYAVIGLVVQRVWTSQPVLVPPLLALVTVVLVQVCVLLALIPTNKKRTTLHV